MTLPPFVVSLSSFRFPCPFISSYARCYLRPLPLKLQVTNSQKSRDETSKPIDVQDLPEDTRDAHGRYGRITRRNSEHQSRGSLAVPTRRTSDAAKSDVGTFVGSCRAPKSAKQTAAGIVSCVEWLGVWSRNCFSSVLVAFIEWLKHQHM